MFRTVDTNAVCQSKIQQQPSQNEKSFFLPSYDWYKRLLWHFVHKNLKLEIKRFLESKGNKVNKEWERITKLFIKIIFMLQKGKASSHRRKALKRCLVELRLTFSIFNAKVPVWKLSIPEKYLDAIWRFGERWWGHTYRARNFDSLVALRPKIEHWRLNF